MRYSHRVITIALPAVFILLFWMGLPTWGKAGSTKYAFAWQAARNIVLAQESTAPVSLAETETPEPTRSPRPTPTPLTVPPPSNPNTIQMMVIFGILVVLVVIFGLVLNRNRVF